MASQPINIPADIAAKYDQPNQFETLDQVFKRVIILPSDQVDAVMLATKHKPHGTIKGRPKKDVVGHA